MRHEQRKHHAAFKHAADQHGTIQRSAGRTNSAYGTTRRNNASCAMVAAEVCHAGVNDQELGAAMKQRLEKWRLSSRTGHHIKITNLWLYPELDCSACIDEAPKEATGEDQLIFYVGHIKRRYPHWWDNDAVPIAWFVAGDGDGFGLERAPFNINDGDDIRTHYHTPINVRSGHAINWYTSLPVYNRRFPKFAVALGWLPSPGQMFAPLRSIFCGAPQKQSSEASAQGKALEKRSGPTEEPPV